jgi:hypothetical protein
MANIFNRFLNNVGYGITHPKGQMGDFQHAARLFTDDSFRLSPKLKFQYHVAFSINPSALKNLALNQRHINEINMLVKTASLPNFTIQTDTVNQYNRKKIINTKIDYQPVTIKFHDDNYGLVNQLWQNYYGYYFADSRTAKSPGTYDRDPARNGNYYRQPYGLDNNSSIPFFRKITLYQMARQEYVSYTLINPKITAWNHETMDYSAATPHENTMTVGYEAVTYDAGRVRRGDPEGFALEHYDLSPSPLSVAGGGTSTLFGRGGVIAGAADVIGDIFSGKAFEDPASFITTAIKSVNTYENSKRLTNAGLQEEGQRILKGSLNSVARSGGNGFAFPQSGTVGTQVTQATQVKL